MQRKILSFIKKEKLFEPGQKVVVAVSGGADSMALLHVLVHSDLQLRLVVAHLNHNLRGDESDGDAAFVKNHALRLGISCEIGIADVKGLARSRKTSLEEAGREARLEFLQAVANHHGGDKIALAHHADDQAETVLLMLIRGAGTSGLGGMVSVDSLRKTVRPLLCVSRQEIDDYVAHHRIEFRTDSSNSDLHFLRNRVRHELLPLLKQYNPGIVDRLAVTADLLSIDDTAISRAVDGMMSRHALVSCDSTAMDILVLCQQERAIRYRIYRAMVERIKGDLRRISYDHVNSIDDIVCCSRPRGKVILPDGVVAKRSYNKLFVQVGDILPASYEINVEGPGCYTLPVGGEVSIEIVPRPKDFAAASTVAYFDLVKVPFPWIMRTYRPGDHFYPFGMTGRKKLKNLFIDCKIPHHLREQLPLVVSGESIIWVAGIRAARVGAVEGAVDQVAKAVLRGFESLN